MHLANNPKLVSWLNVPENSDFPIQNIPFGIFKTKDLTPRLASRIGNTVIDLQVLAEAKFFADLNAPVSAFSQPVLNSFMDLGKPVTNAVRNRIAELFSDKSDKAKQKLLHKALHELDAVELLMPVKVGDYTDFYSSREHATNVGCMFRDPANALMPNWLHLPVGYHGRASSIVVSGTPIHRPKGQTKQKDADNHVYGPCRLLDFELEMAFVVGKSTNLGDSVSTDQAPDHIFGLCLFNDWSARDIQKWEYVPLGPFLGKSFASSISPWIVTLEALQPFRLSGPEQDPEVLPYLKYKGEHRYDINLEVQIQVEGHEPHTVSNSNYKNMYWNMCQQLAHHTVNGCNINAGDMCASGTISGSTPDSYGSMLEISWQGKKSIKMPDGSERKFINDSDTVIMKGFGEKDGLRIGFGEVSGKILPAK